MSRENVEVVRQVVEAFNRRDLAAMTRRFDPEIEWEPAGPAAVERPVYRGRDDVSSRFAAAWEAWEVFRVEESELRDLEDSIVWLGRAQLKGGTSHVCSTKSSPSTSWSATARSPAFAASFGGKRPSKPPGSRSSRCRRRTWIGSWRAWRP